MVLWSCGGEGMMVLWSKVLWDLDLRFHAGCLLIARTISELDIWGTCAIFTKEKPAIARAFPHEGAGGGLCLGQFFSIAKMSEP